jgi:hypothetical protein
VRWGPPQQRKWNCFWWSALCVTWGRTVWSLRAPCGTHEVCVICSCISMRTGHGRSEWIRDARWSGFLEVLAVHNQWTLRSSGIRMYSSALEEHVRFKYGYQQEWISVSWVQLLFPCEKYCPHLLDSRWGYNKANYWMH